MWINPRHRRSPKNQTLNNILPNWDSGEGIVSLLSTLTTAPWQGTDPAGLDIAYHGQRSGEKFIQSYIYKYLDENGQLTEEGVQKLVSAIQARYYRKWTRLWATYSAEYNPLNSYSYTETENRSRELSEDRTEVRTPNLTTHDVIDEEDTASNTGTQSTTYGRTDRTSETGNTTSVDSQWAFNSTDEVNVAKNVTTPNVTTQSTAGGTDGVATSDNGSSTHDGDNTSTLTGTDTRRKSGGDTEEETIERTRQGNLYRSPAELLEADRNFWLTDYFDLIFRDLDEMLTLAIYSESSVNYTVL